MLRHSFATRKIEGGMPAEVLKIIMGHRDIETTLNTYCNVFNEYKNFERNDLIESEMVKIEKYNKVRNYIKMNKFTISKVIGKRIINIEEFKRIEKMVV